MSKNWKKQDRRDRYDRIYLKDLDAMHTILPMLMPKRCNNEAVTIEMVETQAIRNYLAQKNSENPAFKYTLFHVFMAAISKIMILRPHMNWFISGHRIFAHRDVTLAFMVKRAFNEKAEESIARFTADPEGGSLVNQAHDFLEKFVTAVRTENKVEKTSNTIGFLKKLPLFTLRFFFWAIHKLEDWSLYPKVLADQDPSYCSAFLTNIGSLGMTASYHHLYEGGTMSCFAMLDACKVRPVFQEDGTYQMKETVKVSFTLDERIVDGYYCGTCIKLFHYLMQHPEVLDQPASAPVDFDYKKLR